MARIEEGVNDVKLGKCVQEVEIVAASSDRQALVVSFSTPVVFRDGRSPRSWPPRVKGEGSPALQPAGRNGRLHAVGHWPRAGSPVLAMTFIRRSIKSLSP